MLVVVEGVMEGNEAQLPTEPHEAVDTPVSPSNNVRISLTCHRPGKPAYPNTKHLTSGHGTTVLVTRGEKAHVLNY